MKNVRRVQSLSASMAVLAVKPSEMITAFETVLPDGATVAVTDGTTLTAGGSSAVIDGYTLRVDANGDFVGTDADGMSIVTASMTVMSYETPLDVSSYSTVMMVAPGPAITQVSTGVFTGQDGKTTPFEVLADGHTLIAGVATMVDGQGMI